MREIKFRGKSNEFGSVPKNRWVYGDLRTKDGHVTIEDNVYGLLVGVDRDTVGQFTGLRDSNGVEMYEGDILRSDNGLLWEVAWDSDNARFVVWQDENNSDYVDNQSARFLRVVGNIYDSKS